MKILSHAVILGVAIAFASGVYAQSFEQSNEAMKRGDNQAAFAGFTKLAEKGNSHAQFMLGMMYEFGQGIPADDGQAFMWYKKSAEQGESIAQARLGLLYAKGLGTTKNDQQAVLWYLRAADQGDPDAQYHLATRYAEGRGLPKDSQKAYFWSLLASKRGYRDLFLRDDAARMAGEEGKNLTPQQRAGVQSSVQHWKQKIE